VYRARKVWYVIGSLDNGGSERQLLGLAARLAAEGYEPRIICLMDEGPLAGQAHRNGVAVEALGLKRMNGWRAPCGLLANLVKLGDFFLRLRREKPDIVHAYLYHSRVLALPLAALAGVPLRITALRGLYHPKNAALRALEDLANRCAHAVIANSRAALESAAEHENLREAEGRVIYNGIESSCFQGLDRAAAREDRGWAPDDAVLISVANLIPYKGHEMLLRGAALVLRDHPSARFILVGNDHTGIRGRLEALAAELSIAERVEFHEGVTDVAPWLAAADISLLCSTEEGLPNALLESMAAGLPVVATAVGGSRELVREGQTGYLVPSGDHRALAQAIGRLLASPARCAEFGRAARETVEREYSWERMVGETLEAYRTWFTRLGKA